MTTGTYALDVSVHADAGFLVYDKEDRATRVSLKDIQDRLTGFSGIAVIKCKHCGQWGARFCECVKCGAPIE